MKLGILASGGLGLLLLRHLFLSREISFVMTDKNSEQIKKFCEENGIEFYTGNPRNGKCSAFIKEKKIDVLISVNYLFIIERELINLPRKIAFNIHGSLLPRFRGRTPHVWAIINNEKETGVTAHLIVDDCDTGDIIMQTSIPIDENDTGADILYKFHKEYIATADAVLIQTEQNRLALVKQDDSKSSYFGKRTPADGKIDWNWQKERIRNWVRAQASPYPGSFTYYNGKKITIDKIRYVDFKFSGDMTNGLIVSDSPFLVKTPNGVVEITETREQFDIEIGQILH